MWTAIDNVYARGVFRIEDQQALILEGTVGACDHWSIQLWSPFLASGDHRHRTVSVNHATARLDADGRFRVAVTTHDPRIPDLDHVSTCGGHQGTFVIRWMCPGGSPPPPTCRLTDLAELRR